MVLRVTTIQGKVKDMEVLSKITAGLKEQQALLVFKVLTLNSNRTKRRTLAENIILKTSEASKKHSMNLIQIEIGIKAVHIVVKEV